MDIRLVTIKIEDREKSSKDVQATLTEFGANIRVRLGLHDMARDENSPIGLIILEVTSGAEQTKGFVDKLNSIDSVKALTQVI